MSTAEREGSMVGPFVHTDRERHIITLTYGKRGKVVYRCDDNGQLLHELRNRSDPRLSGEVLSPHPKSQTVQDRVSICWTEGVPDMWFGQGEYLGMPVRGLVLDVCEVQVSGITEAAAVMAAASPYNDSRIPVQCVLHGRVEPAEPDEAEEALLEAVLEKMGGQRGDVK